MYVPLRVHGHHSLLTGVDGPERLLARAAELGLPALALTDVDTLAGSFELLRAHAACERDGARSLARPILGAELSDPGGPGRLVALVEDARGYANLCKLVSARRLGEDPGTRGARLDGPAAFDLVGAALRFQEGLRLLVDHPRLVYELAGRVPRERLLVAVSPAALRRPVPPSAAPAGSRVRRLRGTQEAPELDDPKVAPPARAAPALDLVESARVFGLATVAVPDVYLASAEGWEHHRVRTAIKHNALLCDLPERWLAERPAHLIEPARLAELYCDLPDLAGPFRRARRRGLPGALARTLFLAERCRYLPPLDRVLFPAVELAPGDTAYSRLCSLAFDGARRRYVPLSPAVVRRLDHELSAIEELGYAPYFLLVKKIADFAKERGIPCVGRGSAADSLVAFCLALTDADPLRYQLPFERFLNPARKDRPDIDLDFCWRRRDEVLAHVGEAFGAERTAMISTLNRFGLRSAFREVALAVGLPPALVNRWSRRLPAAFGGAGEGGAAEGFDGTAQAGEAQDELDGAAGAEAASDGPPPLVALPADLASNPLARSFASTPECRDFPFEDERWARVLRLAAALLDAPRHLGLHPGGVVVAPDAITDAVACQRAAKGVIVTQLDKDGVEAIGLVKMDLLGNRALTVIDDCLGLLRARGLELDLLALPEDDPATAELLAQGRTIGCSQVESPGMRNLLKQTAARTMDDVIQAVALIRPGPAGSGMKDAYVRRFRGLEEPAPPHPLLAETLAETHGVMLYQEDVMQAVVVLAGLSLAEADGLRRALTKRRGAELERLRGRFFAGAAARGVEPAGARRVWELVSNFSSFGFCKAHAVTYGRIAYRAVYLKAHHPAELLTAFLNSDTGYYETRVYVEEARRLGVVILPPDVNRSGRGFALEPAGPAGGARAAIRVGLERVKGLSADTLASLFAERERGPFLSLPDFLARSPAQVDEVASLIQCGAFDAFDRTRPEMLWRLHLLTAPARRPPRPAAGQAPRDPAGLAAGRDTPEGRAWGRVRDARLSTQGWTGPSIGVGRLSLGPGESAALFPEPLTPAVALPQLPETDAATRGRLELELLGLTVTDHPTVLFRDPAHERALRGFPTIPCAALDQHRGRRVALVGWLAASRRVRTSDGRWMRFLTLEDTTGIAEVVLFADAYARHGHHLVSRGPFRIAGSVEDQMGACTLHAELIG